MVSELSSASAHHMTLSWTESGVSLCERFRHENSFVSIVLQCAQECGTQPLSIARWKTSLSSRQTHATQGGAFYIRSSRARAGQ